MSADKWIDAGLDVRFDPAFRAELVEAMESPERFANYLEYNEYRADLHTNMDY